MPMADIQNGNLLPEYTLNHIQIQYEMKVLGGGEINLELGLMAAVEGH